MPGITLVRRGMALALLTGVGVLLARRAGLAAVHYPPLAALGPAPGLLAQPVILLMEAAMTRCRTLFATIVLVGGFLAPGLVGTAVAFESPSQPSAVPLQLRPPVAPGVASLPLATGSGPATERINRSLAAAEQQLRRDIGACQRQGQGGASSGWTRTVTVTSNGPRFLSFLVDDISFCGGPYPNSERSALVYDLRSGAPVTWEALLPARFAIRVRGSWMPPLNPVPVESWPLLKLYRRYYPAQLPGIDPSLRDTCRQSVENGITLWPDTAAHALMLQATPQNHAAAACAVPVALTAPILRAAGVSSELLEALGIRPLAETVAAPH